MLLENIRLAIIALKANKLRTFLTMLGIIIGLTSVVMIMTIGNAMNNMVNTQMGDMGANNFYLFVNMRSTDADGNVRTKHRSEEEYKALMNRLKRIEGQIQGIQRMLENEAYCPDILVQVSAVNAALNGFNKELLASHLRSCVVSDIRSDDPAAQEEAVDELVTLLRKLMK
jgi:DNA-binding FrmR family transcriptional regulator